MMNGSAGGRRCHSGFAGLKFVLFRFGLWIALLLGGQMPLRAVSPSLFIVPPSTNPPAPGDVVRMGWSPSPSPNAAGYFLCWGFASGQCTNQLDAGNVTNVSVAGFAANTTYFFTIVTYSDTGDQSGPSNEIQYSVPSFSAPAPPLDIQPGNGTNSNPSAVSLSFQASAGITYTILATQDFLQWDAVWSTNCVSDGAVVFSAGDTASYPWRFYRLVQQ
jgi:hypothetical protein